MVWTRCPAGPGSNAFRQVVGSVIPVTAESMAA